MAILNKIFKPYFLQSEKRLAQPVISKHFYTALTFLLSATAIPNIATAALAGEQNKEPELCQGIAGAAYAASTAVAIGGVPPADTAANFLAYVANLNLKLCPPQIEAPASIYGVEPDTTNECVHSFSQTTTEGEYQNVLGAPILLKNKYPSNWGQLGTPKTYHFNSDAAVGLFGYEDNNGTIELPVGRNTLVWRADTTISIMDLVPFHIPKIVSGTKAQKILVKNTPPLKAVAKAGYKAFAKKIGKKVGEVILEEGVAFGIDQAIDISWKHSQIGIFDDVFTTDIQSIWVYDKVPPIINTNTNNNSFSDDIAAIVNYDDNSDTYILEAFQPGGVLSSSALPVAENLLSYSDNCDTKLSLSHTTVPELWPVGDEVEVTWTVTDPGPVRAPVIINGELQDDGGHNTAQVTQRFRIEDTNPPILLAPPSKVVEVPNGTNQSEVPLGSPRVFDLADLDPEITADNSSTLFDLGLSEVTWTATDAGGNSSQAVQLINVKAQGSNSIPQANNQTVAATAFTPIDITLTASDADFHPSVNRFDPLTFSIIKRPQNGFFIAPLLPFFIEDYRLEASIFNNAGELDQSDPDLFCQNGGGGGSVWNLKYPYRPQWMTVDDASNTVVFDEGRARCDASNTKATYSERLVVFGPDGELLRSLSMSDNVRDISLDTVSDRLLVLTASGVNNGIVAAYNKDEDDFGIPPGSGSWAASLRLRNVAAPTAIVQDHQNFLYVQEDNGSISVHQVVWTDNASSQSDADTFRANLVADWSSSGNRDMTIDSQSNLYVQNGSRIFKFSAAGYDDNGNFISPQMLGWLGKCVGNKTNTVACDVTNQRSIGFSCTDALCERAQPEVEFGNIPDAGNQPGQFKGMAAVAMNPKDILYVAEPGNQRVQRFTPEGYFAGQAKSQGQGYGFILGDFGRLDNISVNSDNFYILQRKDPLGGDQGLLHVFKTTPITPIDDQSAKVTYQSSNNFQGTDNFIFSATDGLDNDEATVTINVERDFRQPTIPHPPTKQTLDEDGSIIITLSGSDPDGDLDVLSYEIVSSPGHGSVELVGDQLNYTPAPNYAGEDSFTYRVYDGRFYSEPASVEITVKPIADEPLVEVTVPETAGVGFNFPLSVTVFDPDEGADHNIIIEWNDGVIEESGEILVDGVIATGPILNDDGSLPDNIETTGPIYSIGPNGYGNLSTNHAYTRSGTYQILVCAVDKIFGSTSANTGCKTVTVTIEPRVAYRMTTDASAEEAHPGETITFTASLENKDFDVAPEDGTQGVSDTNVVISGNVSPSLRNLRPASGLGMPLNTADCTFDTDTFRCEVGDMPFLATKEITLEADVDSLAPGLSLLTMSSEAEGTAPLHQPVVGGVQVKVIAGETPPQLVSLTPDFGKISTGTQVTLHGNNFQEGAAVYFGNRLAKITDITDSETVVTQAPAQSAGTVDVVVINPDDRSDKLAQVFTYKDTPAVTVPPQEKSGGGGGGSLGLSIPLALLVLLIRFRYLSLSTKKSITSIRK